VGRIMSLHSPRMRRLALVAALFGLGMSLGQPHAPAREPDRTYRVIDVASDDVLNIRAGPSAGHAIVGAIPPGARGVRLVGRCQGWCPISYNGASGWVKGRYLAPEPDAYGFAAEGTVTLPRAGRAGLPGYWQVTGVEEGESLMVHEGPSASAPVVHAFEPQSGCIKLAGTCQKPWCQVMFPGLSGARVGWVDSKHLAPASTGCGN
jgi:SH3-like domain-containing protein